jgi:hypothetical protein
LLVCINVHNKTTNAIFLYTNPCLGAVRAGRSARLAKKGFLVLCQANKQVCGMPFPLARAKMGLILFFVDKKWRIVYKLSAKIHFNDFARATSNTLAKNIKKI